MTEVVSVRFKVGGKSYYFDPRGINVGAGRHVIVETSKGLEYGECVRGNYMVGDDKIIPPLRPIIRVADERDVEAVAVNKKKESRAYTLCSEKISEHNLDMKLVDVEYNFEGNKILFFFTSDGRVDFRDLVKDLAAIFRTRIELRQIGVRDEAKILGGLGICGKPFCCAQFLDEFQPVSIKMAKTQSLSLNPAKISGTCGRLMCCLKYEQDAYESLVKNAPKVDSYVQTPEGNGTITDVNLLRQRVKVRLDGKSGDAIINIFSTEEITFIKTGKQRRADLLAKRDAPEETQEPVQAQESATKPRKKKLQDKLQKQAGQKTAPTDRAKNERQDRDVKKNEGKNQRKSSGQGSKKSESQNPKSLDGQSAKKPNSRRKRKPAQSGPKPENSGDNVSNRDN